MLFRHARGCRIQIILGVSFMEFGGLASALQPVSLAHLDDSVQLCDSIHQTPSQVQGHPLYIDNRQRYPCPMSRDRPLSKGCDRVSPVPSSRDEIKVLQHIFHHTQKRQYKDSTTFSSLGYGCLPASSQRSRNMPFLYYGRRASKSSPNSTTGLY